jgi:hypothetical protein
MNCLFNYKLLPLFNQMYQVYHKKYHNKVMEGLIIQVLIKLGPKSLLYCYF